MSDHHKQTEFLKHCLRYDESARRKELEQQIARIQRDERCVRRAVWLMAVLTALAVTGLAYPAILLANFPYSVPQSIVNGVCALGVASLISLMAFVVLSMVYRRNAGPAARGMPSDSHQALGVPVGQPSRHAVAGTFRQRRKRWRRPDCRRRQRFSSKHRIGRVRLSRCFLVHEFDEQPLCSEPPQ